jgi:predicted amidohydrolase YtcJ
MISERIIDMSANGAREGAGFVAITGGRITAVGPTDEFAAHLGPETTVLDAGARPLMPGFVDVHAHGEVAARVHVSTVDCRAPECSSVGDVQMALSAALPSARDGWLVGQANLFFDQKLEEVRLPTRAELDSVSTDVAVALRAGGHVTVLNTRALELAGIGARFELPAHSITGKPDVLRDSDGNPTGVVKEMDNLLPITPELDQESMSETLEQGFAELFTRNGVTSIGEISESVEGLRCMDRLSRSDRLPVRVFAYLWAPGTVSIDEACDWRNVLAVDPASPLFTVQGAKLFADGGYSAASAAVKHDYVGRPGFTGSLALSAETLGEALAQTREAGLQLAVHANGDRAQEHVCAAVEAAGGAPAGRLRTRVEHGGNFLPDYEETTEAWRRAGIIPVPQPVFLYTFGDFFPTYLGDHGRQGRFPFRRLLDDGWQLSGSSDVWVGSERPATNPLFSIWCCVERRSFRGEIIDADQRIGVEEALRMHTIDAAAVLGRDDELGSIEVGKAADLIVLDRDPRTSPVDELVGIEVDLTVLGGRVVHQRDGARGFSD